MGTTSIPGATKAEVKQAALAELNAIVLKHRTVGSNLWVALLDASGIGYVVLIRFSKYGGDWGWKTMDECSHPYSYDCPQSILDLIPEVPRGSEYATEWRKCCADYRALDSLQPGAVLDLIAGTIPLSGTPQFEQVTYLYPYKQPNQIVIRKANGKVYRVSKDSVVAALREKRRPAGS